MNKTSCTITFGRNAIAIADDAQITLLNGGLQSFGDLDSLESNLVSTLPYATYEPNFWLLDGNYKFVPSSNGRAGWISTAMSGASGNFDYSGPEPEIQIDFDDVHSTDGLTLTFSELTGDYADSIYVQFYNSGLTLIRADIYSPTSTSFFTNQSVANFKRILIRLTSANRAQRYARLSRIDFDEVVVFSGANVKAARLIEDINPLSDELTINTLDLTLFSADGDFSITNPVGVYADLQYKDPLDVYEVINGLPVYMGRFYLDKWQSQTENLATFQASDAVGLLDKPKYIGGLYQGETVAAILAEIMTAANVDYELDGSLSSIAVVGLIELYSTCREALQQLCFYAGAYVTCARSKTIQILPLPVPPGISGNDHVLAASSKSINSPLKLKPLITGVEIHDKEWYSDEFPTSEVLFDKVLAVGSHTIVLATNTKMPSGLVLAGSAIYTITANRYFYVIVNVTSSGTVRLEQNEGIVTSESFEGIYSGSLPAGSPENVITITNATLPRDSAATGQILTSTIAQRLYDYYQRRYLQETKLFASPIVVGDSVLVDVQSGQQLSGIVERMETDLAMGFVSNVEIVGIIV